MILSSELDGKVGDRLAAARVFPEAGRGVTFVRACAESPVVQADDPTLRARKVMSPRWYWTLDCRLVITSNGRKSNFPPLDFGFKENAV